MCGRTACTLDPTQIICACRYRNQSNVTTDPIWETNLTGTPYLPSYNLCPTDYSPVLIAGSHITRLLSDKRVIMPMRWGLIPSWHKGEPAAFQYSTTNCRSDHLVDSKICKRPMDIGQRCVVLADGFYEWKKSEGKFKQPHFIYFSQNESTKWDQPGEETEVYGSWAGRKLLTMAGLFDRSQEGKMCSYTVITVEASEPMTFLHDRMPAILETDAEIAKWIDPKTSVSDAMSLLKPVANLSYHRVGTAVNNARNKQSECITPFVDSPKKRSPQKNNNTPTPKKKAKLDPNQMSMMSFLKKEETQ